ncbi:pyridoxal phosphate-dependent aminotransferase [Candidatus Gottesmanbacteria bacterium]|nr:pyridoxal phosphate-dependent aminotransferase [Candidatus Gottesmanbacteria bacterium]
MLDFILPSLSNSMSPPPDGPRVDRSEQAGLEIIRAHVAGFRDRWENGQIASPIRDLTLMVEGIKYALTEQGLVGVAKRVHNLTIGDVHAENLGKDGNIQIAQNLGLDPRGDIFKSMFSEVIGLWKTSWDEGNSSVTRYQADALGFLALRERFTGFIRNFGLDFESTETIITGGSLPGINMVFKAIQDMARNSRRATRLIAPTPGFSVYYVQAEKMDIPVIKIPTDAFNGFCTSGESLEKALTIGSPDHDILYLTIPNNPTSTTYELQSLADSLSSFHALRPNGVIVVDLAYIEMIPKEQASALLSLFEKTDTLSQAVFAVSMSKNFGFPRLRAAALLTKNTDIFHALQSTSQTTYASQSSPMELLALTMWKYVTPEARQDMFDLFRRRQHALLVSLAIIDRQRVQEGKPVLIDPERIYTDIPLYVCAGLLPGTDIFTVFEKTFHCGVPIEVFGGSNGMVRFSVGIEPLARLA